MKFAQPTTKAWCTVGVCLAVLITTVLCCVEIRHREFGKQIYRIGFDNNQPQHFLGKDGKPEGLAVDLVNEAAKRRGIDFSSGDLVTSVTVSNGRATGVKTIKTAFHADKVVNCAGAW